jgi:hypothetical protein
MSCKLTGGLLLSVGALLGQSPTATITGFVRDPQGAVIVGAKTAAINVATGISTAVSTNDNGFYSLRQLAIGEYRIEAGAAGFRQYERKGIVLSTGQALELNIALEVGSVSETVTVSGAASVLDTRTSSVGQLIESKAVEDLPLGDRRSMNLVRTTGAAVFVSYGSGSKASFSLAGGRTTTQSYFIDGGTGQNMRIGVGETDVDPPVETVAEVKVIGNNYAAEYGGSAGGVVVVTTKSGTNQYHGSLYEYLRNDKTDAANFFAPVVDGAKQKAPLRYNVFGGTTGGRIVRDKTFFFFGYEGSRRRNGITRTLTVPTAAQKGGDFSQTFDARGALIPIYDPSTTRTEGGRTLRDAFAGNRIPQGRLDAVAVNLLPFFPLPNRAADNASGANNFRSNYVNALTRNNFTVKIDHNLSSRDRVNARYIYNSDIVYNTSVYPNPVADNNNTQDRHQQFWYGAWTRTVSPTVVNDLRITYGTRINHTRSPGLGGNWASQLGLKGAPDGAFPYFAPAGFATIGSNANERQQYPIQQYQLVEDLSWIRGKHSFKFGMELRPSLNHEINRNGFAGSFSFATTGSGMPGVSASGNGLASMLLGFVTGFSTTETQELDRYSYYIAGFAQDDWNVSRNLTLNFGVRWETDTPLGDRNLRANSFDAAQTNPVSGTPGVVKFLGVNGWRDSMYNGDWNNFGPRLGFAWKVSGSSRTVVRGGYGIFYSHPYDAGAPNGNVLGFSNSASINTPDNGVTAPFYLRQGVPAYRFVAPVLDDSFGAVAVGKQATSSVSYFEADRHTGYSQQFNLGVQRELRAGVLVEASYIGNLSHKLPSSNMSVNQIRPELMGARATQSNRPYPQFSDVTLMLPTLGVAAYHAGAFKLERRFSKGFSVLATYTWSKNLNNTSEGPGGALGSEASVYSDFYNRRADRGRSANDAPQRFTFTSVFELPFGAGHRWLTHQWMGRVIGGWSVGALGTMQSGAPFTITTQVNSTNAFSAGSLRADVLRDPSLPSDQRSIARWFDVDAFRQPAAYRFGNSGINILRGQALRNLDFSILRNFPIRERLRLQFRGEFINGLNHPTMGIPGQVLGAAGFGVVSSASDARTVQMGLRMVF